MQDQGCGLPLCIVDEADLCVDELVKEPGLVLRIDRGRALSGQLREQLRTLTRHRQDGVVVELIEPDIAVEDGGIQGDLASRRLAGVVQIVLQSYLRAGAVGLNPGGEHVPVMQAEESGNQLQALAVGEGNGFGVESFA